MMKKISGIDNQQKGYITSKEACLQLSVRAATLYSYASRGLIHCLRLGGREKLYSQEDVARLSTRSSANKGHTAVASGALRWGEPVLDSKITRVEDGQLSYRGKNLLALLDTHKTFEEVSQLLWETSSPLSWRPFEALPPTLAARPILRLIQVSSQQAINETEPESGDTIAHYSAWVASFAAVLGADLTSHTKLSEALCAGYQRPLHLASIIDRALIVCADHELNVSTFTARIAASAGASLASCLAAALFTFTGKKHGGACEEVELYLQDLAPLANGERRLQIERWLLEKRIIPGFGHRLYQHQDPRTAPLIQAAAEAKNTTPKYLALRQLIELMIEAGHVPTVDAAMVLVAEALSLPRGSATALFALGRSVGWIAHISEQRQQDVLLRPRARYTGPV